jgi:hypothetical protein
MYVLGKLGKLGKLTCNLSSGLFAPAGNRIRGSSLEGTNVATTPPEQYNT